MIKALFSINWHAVRLYRIANFFYTKGYKKIAFIISSFSRVFTGVEIEPAAIIGKNFTIMHGNGIVIGGNSIIGDNVIIYQQVTIGGKRHVRGIENFKNEDARQTHAILGNNITIYAGAKLIGSIIVGDNVEIGANSVVTKDIVSNTIVGGIPAKILRYNNK